MAKVTANNILSGSINTDKLDTSVVNNLSTAVTANNTATSALVAAQAAYNSANTTATTITNIPPVISSVTITDSSWNALDDTAANTTGGYCVITGSGFVSGATVIFGTTSASAVTFANSTSLRVQVPTLSAASYPTYVVNPNGATAIKVSGLTTSSFPVWGTAAALANTAANTAFSVSLSANSDSSITYANTTALPAGTTLAANGYFSGTVSIGTETTYSFDVKATDAEYQDSSRTFSLTVTVGPQTKLWSWGTNSFGTLGQNDTFARSSPTQIGTRTDWNKIGSLNAAFMATTSANTMYTWGMGNSGQLATSSTLNSSSPIQVGAGTDWAYPSRNASVVGGAIKTNGSLWVWGYNTSNLYLGGLSGYRSSPAQLGAYVDWLTVITHYQSFGIKTGGSLWAWGTGPGGGLGNNSTANILNPTQIGALTNWSKIAGMYQTTGAVKTDGTLWTWGVNTNGQLGSNNTTSRSSPVQVGAATNWRDISTSLSSGFFMAIKTDGTLWGWGNNTNGQLGSNNTTSRSSPVQIGASTNWSKILVGPNATKSCFAIKTDGTLWGWGGNANGELGTNDVVYRSSPVQIGSATYWTDILATQAGVLALTTQ
jgi:alpha-tubulin suppressor-like RCC1 family protein